MGDGIHIMDRMSKFLWPVALFVLLASPSLANRQGDALIRRIKAMKAPKWIEAKAGDAAYEAAWEKAYKRYTRHRNALIWKLYRVDPKNSKTADYMYDRWMQFDDMPSKDSEVPSYIKRIQADIDRVMAGPMTPAIKEVTLAAQVSNDIYAIYTDPSTEAVAIQGVVKFAQTYPKSKRLKDLMVMACYGVTEASKPRAIARFLEKFPDDAMSKLFVKTLRQSTSIGKPFELKFMDAMTGQDWDIAANRGKVVLVDFWATWCGPCRETIPELKSLYANHHAAGLEIVGISLDDSEAKGGLKKLKDFVVTNKMPWPQYHQGNGWESPFSSSWGINGVPTTFLIDKQGNLRAVNERKLKERIESLLSE